MSSINSIFQNKFKVIKENFDSNDLEYNTKDLVSFAKFVLSKDRNDQISGDKKEVYDADLANWTYLTQ